MAVFNVMKQSGAGRKPDNRVREVRGIREALDHFFARHKGRGNFILPQLWESWPMVMGDNLGFAALPLGVHDRTLIVGAEDSMLMHELSFCTPEILARANAFMNASTDEEYFSKVRIELLRGRTPLYPTQTAAKKTEPEEPRPRPPELGSLLGVLDPDSTLGRAYISYVKSFDSD